MHFEGVQFVTHAYRCKTILCILFNAKGVQLAPYNCVESVVPVRLFPEGVWVGWGVRGTRRKRDGRGGAKQTRLCIVSHSLLITMATPANRSRHSRPSGI